MATRIRPELSTKNRYWVSKNRHYELKHFCLQYPEWKKAYSELDGFTSRTSDPSAFYKSNTPSDPTSRFAEQRSSYLEKMRMVEQAAIEADPDLYTYILKAVTEELSFNMLKSKLDIPCSRDMYYDRYRRFFWLLDKTRD